MSQPLHRFVYRAQCRPGQQEATIAAWRAREESLRTRQAGRHILTASVFAWQDQFFLYYETVNPSLLPDTLAGEMDDLLESWPGHAQPRRFVPMMDIFHCGEPTSEEYWRRKTPPEQVSARITRLQPEMVSSYIFYHYQMQEEKPGSFDKYCLISIHENLLFFYRESPNVVESPPRTGKLSTQNTPADWHGTMFPHFRLWDDAPMGEEIWRGVELVLHIGAGSEAS